MFQLNNLYAEEINYNNQQCDRKSRNESLVRNNPFVDNIFDLNADKSLNCIPMPLNLYNCNEYSLLQKNMSNSSDLTNPFLYKCSNNNDKSETDSNLADTEEQMTLLPNGQIKTEIKEELALSGGDTNLHFHKFLMA
jgi:hypothetical protein